MDGTGLVPGLSDIAFPSLFVIGHTLHPRRNLAQTL